MLCRRLSLAFGSLAVVCVAAHAQQTHSTPPGNLQPPALQSAAGIAATVDGHQILEAAVIRALRGKADPSRDKREEVLKYLIDNVLIDNYLDQMKIDVQPQEVEAQFVKVKAEIAASGKKLEDFYNEMRINEPELKTQIRASMRWEKFIQQYTNEKTLKDFFDANKAMFDGTSMRARHILISAAAGNPQAAEQAKLKIAMLKKQIEGIVAKGLADAGKLDNLEREKKRMQLMSDAFAAMAAAESTCPSKNNGGDLGWFPRTGSVVESFAKAAFALKPWQMSDAVETEYGYHLILCVDHKAGVERRFEDMRELVKDVYADKMREAIAGKMRPMSKIVINNPPR